jgi:hexosaminidase
LNFDSNGSSFDLKRIQAVHVDPEYADTVNDQGETLIPPTLFAFGQTFAEDLSSAVGTDINVSRGDNQESSVYITIDSAGNYTDAAGRWTAEGYTLDVSETGITITGASPLGAWWGTRSVLQAAALNKGSVPVGTGNDAPGWGHRGIMIDVGRKYYPAPFLIEMCSYLSHFKQNVLHLHLSDNLVKVDPARYDDSVYAAFRLDLPDAHLEGLNRRKNESYSREVFEEIQTKCAARGVTIVPEIEAPGHALVITQWKPEIALEGDRSYLDLDNPETLPAVQSIWDAALPWFHSKTVHLGADEYSSEHIQQYNDFVIKLSDHIKEVSGKNSRIWGTFPPRASYTNNIPTDVTIQHWAAFADNALFDYIKNNYSVVNSDDGFYVVNKYSGSYPQKINFDRVFHGNPADQSQFAPWVFDGANSTNNAEPSEPRVIGHEAAIWNDFGPTATVVSETYAALRRGLPALADKQWGGDLTEPEFNAIFETLHASIPAQNLDLAIDSRDSTILQYDFGSVDGNVIVDQSGNGYNATNNGCQIVNSTITFDGNCHLSTSLDLKGPDYKLAFQIQVQGTSTGSLIANDVYALTSQNGAITFIAEGTPYPIDYTLPEGTWTYLELSGKDGHTYLKVDNGTQFEFMTTFDVSGTGTQTKEIAIPLPLSSIGQGFKGNMRDIVVSNSA